MYRDYDWRGGKLYIRSAPTGPWIEASTQETICWLVERVAELERRATHLEAENEKTIRAFASNETI